MTFTKPRDLLLTAVLVGIVAHLLIRLSYASLPPVPRFAGVTLGVLAVVELVFGFTLRARINDRQRRNPVPPLTAARAVVLAKASSLAGSIMVGAWGALLVYVAPNQGVVTAASADLVTAIVGLVCAFGLIGAALWLEYCCKTPGGNDDADQSSGPV